MTNHWSNNLKAKKQPIVKGIKNRVWLILRTIIFNQPQDQIFS